VINIEDDLLWTYSGRPFSTFLEITLTISVARIDEGWRNTWTGVRG